MAANIGLDIVSLITGMTPAKLIDRSGKTSSKRKSTQLDIEVALSPYINNNFENGKAGERFNSDHWQNSPGWAVSLPEIVASNGTTYLGCRWWNYVGGFSSQAHITNAIVDSSDGEKQSGWIIFMKGVGYTPNSQWFLAKDGTLFEYIKEVKSHEPVRYMPTGGINVGWTETIISTDLKPADTKSDSLRDLMKILKNSNNIQKREGLRPIMKGYFSLG